MYRVSPTDDSKEATAAGLDVDFTDPAEVKKIMQAFADWDGTDVSTFIHLGRYGLKVIGGNHKTMAMKEAKAVMPTEKKLHRMEIKVFWGLTTQQQRKVRLRLSTSMHVSMTPTVRVLVHDLHSTIPGRTMTTP